MRTRVVVLPNENNLYEVSLKDLEVIRRWLEKISPLPYQHLLTLSNWHHFEKPDSEEFLRFLKEYMQKDKGSDILVFPKKFFTKRKIFGDELKKFSANCQTKFATFFNSSISNGIDNYSFDFFHNGVEKNYTVDIINDITGILLLS
jgi:hypothetical protein